MRKKNKLNKKIIKVQFIFNFEKIIKYCFYNLNYI